MTRIRMLFFSLIIILTATSAPAADGKGHLVLIGGGDEPDAIWDRIVALAGGPQASFVILTTATENTTSGPAYKSYLEQDYGCSHVAVIDLKTSEDAHNGQFVGQIRDADCVFFTGGDQTRIISALNETPAAEALGGAFERGAVVAGTSAGAAIGGVRTITGNGDFTVIKSGSVELWPGLGFFPDTITDQHFIARQRLNRLLTVILENPRLLGVGIDEKTAVWLRPDGTFEVIGAGSVVVIDASATEIDLAEGGDGQPCLGARGVKLHILLPGDEFDLKTRTATAGGK